MARKAKYPSLKRPYMQCEKQGYGARKGNNNATVVSIKDERTIENESQD